MLKLAQKAANAGAEILKEHFGNISNHHIREKNKNDFLTFVDELAERKIIEEIKAVYPDHAILAEERGSDCRNSTYKWIIDPLDGTKNYINGIPLFAISIALEVDKQVELGVVLNPMSGEMFSAEKKLGAYLNCKKIIVSKQKNLKNCLLATGFPFKFKNHLSQYMRCFEEIFNEISGARRMGAAAIDLAYVAAGRFDGFWEWGLKPWDVAAGILLIKEAGGEASDFWGQFNFMENGNIVASNGLIHQNLLKIIQKHFQENQPGDNNNEIKPIQRKGIHKGRT